MCFFHLRPVSYYSDELILEWFENTTPINQNKKVKNKRTQNRLIRLIGVVFSNNAVLSVSDRNDSVNERTQEISKLTKLRIHGMRQMPINLLGRLIMSKSCNK